MRKKGKGKVIYKGIYKAFLAALSQSNSQNTNGTNPSKGESFQHNQFP